MITISDAKFKPLWNLISRRRESQPGRTNLIANSRLAAPDPPAHQPLSFCATHLSQCDHRRILTQIKSRTAPKAWHLKQQLICDHYRFGPDTPCMVDDYVRARQQQAALSTLTDRCVVRQFLNLQPVKTISLDCVSID